MSYRPGSPSPGSRTTSFNVQMQCRFQDQVSSILMRLTMSPNDRADALHQLGMHRETIPGLAVQLWDTQGAVVALLSEIISVYPYLSSPSSLFSSSMMNSRLAGKVTNSITLFQCLASHEDTRIPFLKANLPMYLFPFLHTTNQSRECECFKLAALGVIGNLAKSDHPEVVQYLVQNEFVPLCLRVLKFGQEMNRVVAAFILQKLMNHPDGHKAICSTQQRLETVINVLNIGLKDLAKSFDARLSKNILLAYEGLLNDNGVEAIIAGMQMDDFKQMQLSSQCDENFVAFIQRLASVQSRHPKAH